MFRGVSWWLDMCNMSLCICLAESVIVLKVDVAATIVVLIDSKFVQYTNTVLC